MIHNIKVYAGYVKFERCQKVEMLDIVTWFLGGGINLINFKMEDEGMPKAIFFCVLRKTRTPLLFDAQWVSDLHISE